MGKLRTLQSEMEDIISYLMYGIPYSGYDSDIAYSERRNNQSYSYHYQRDLARDTKIYTIFYKGNTLGHFQKAPHAQLTLASRRTLFVNTLLNAVKSVVPNVRIK